MRRPRRGRIAAPRAPARPRRLLSSFPTSIDSLTREGRRSIPASPGSGKRGPRRAPSRRCGPTARRASAGGRGAAAPSRPPLCYNPPPLTEAVQPPRTGIRGASPEEPMSHTLRSAALLALLLASSPPLAAQEIRFNVLPYRLDNGLKVLALEDHAVPTVSYYTFYRVGSRNERSGRTGISHLFEHMMFNGAKKYGPKEFDLQMESRGGSSNAFTTQDMTAYYESFPSEALDLVVDMEADRMAALRIAPDILTSEREVVKEERRLSLDNDVFGAPY